jgi:AcrR family transcriptional regulator
VVSPGPRPLPRGPHNLTRHDVLTSQHQRMIEAMAAAVARKGYAGTTVGDVVADAGVSRKTFYEHFSDKEECFLAAFDAGVDALLEGIVAAQPEEDSWRGVLRARVRGYLGVLAARPGFARTLLIEVYVAGPRALDRQQRVQARFEELLASLHAETRREYPDLPVPPDVVWTAAVGAVNEVVSQQVRQGDEDRLPELEDDLVRILVALFGVPRSRSDG